MDSENILKLNVTLKKLSEISVAIHFWELANVRLVCKKLCEEKRFCNDNYQSEVINHILKLMDSLTLPEVIINSIKELIFMIRQTIVNFVWDLTRKNDFDVKYVQTFYWTSYGTIDKLKIAEEGLKGKTIPPMNLHCFLKNQLFRIATYYANEDFIENNMEKMKEELKAILPTSQIPNRWTVYGILATSICFNVDESETAGLQLFKSYKTSPNEFPAEDLFLLCLSHGFVFAAKYFWNKLNVNQKKQCATVGAEKCLNRLLQYHYNEQNILGMLIFLINEVPDIQQRLKFLSNNFTVLFKYFLRLWPYQELCLNFVNNNPDISEVIWESLLSLVIVYLEKNEKLVFKKKNVYHIIFQNILGRMPKGVKQNYFQQNQQYLCSFMQNLDSVTVSLILTDADLAEHRSMMIPQIRKLLKDEILKGSYDHVNQFLNYLFSDEERKWFKEESNFLGTFLTSGKFELANKNLNFLCKSESEKQEMIEQIDAAKICFNLISKNRFDLADQFLTWRFDSEHERKEFKKRLNPSREYLRNRIYQIWCGSNLEVSMDKIKSKCMELLNWFFDSEEEANEFKKNIVIEKESFVETYWINLPDKTLFTLFIDEFMKFCHWKPEDIKKVKTDIIDNVAWWIDTYAVEKNNFLIIVELLNWVFLNEPPERKQKVIENFMRSPQGALLCVNVIQNENNIPRWIFFDFLDHWVERIPFLDMEMKLNSFDETVVRKMTTSRFLKLLEKSKERKMSFLSRCRDSDISVSSDSD